MLCGWETTCWHALAEPYQDAPGHLTCSGGTPVLKSRMCSKAGNRRLSSMHCSVLPTRPWGFTSLPEHSERLCGLWSDDHGEAIPYFQGGVWGWDDVIAVAVHGDEYTPGWQP